MRPSAVILLLTLMASSVGYGSTSGKNGSNQGDLTVTATVVASMTVVIGPNGEQTYIVANAPGLQRELSAIMMEHAHPNAAPKDPPQPAVHRSKRKR